MPGFVVGDVVRTPLGKGVVRELRSATIVVEIAGRRIVVNEPDVREVEPPKKAPRKHGAPPSFTPVNTMSDGDNRADEVDLHGLVVDEAIARATAAINAALLGNRSQLRVIHGRSGGRIKAALHRELRAIPTVRRFRLDPANEGVTIVEF